MPDVFINYRSDDEAAVAVLIDEKLCATIGPKRVFRDNRSIELGRDYRPELWGSLAKSVVLVVVIGKRWLARDRRGRRRIDQPEDFVRREIAAALSMGIPVVPVLVGEVPALRAENLPDDIAELAHRQYRWLSTRGIQRDLPLLIEELATLARGEPAAAAGPATGRDGTVLMLRLEPPVREWQVAALHQAIDRATADAEMSDIETVTRPTRLTLFVPAAVPPIRVLSRLVGALETVLTDQPVPESGPLRVRAGLHHSTMRSGRTDVCDELAYLLDLPAVAKVRRRATKAGLVLVLPDAFYDGVVRAHPLVADPSTYLPVPIAGGRERCWVHAPGYPSPPGLRSAPDVPSPPDSAGGGPAPAGNHGVQFNNHGPVHGPQVGGDWVNGNKVVRGDEAGYR
ncbi:toll/interleukin-1 receptor domain-containing protein [Plantactinospora sp. BC1]|uniref:toll/interleukin-1 receptor domain-containing protein n=1 Tax=Plantactinospora sp. BC1 TaxID=2108470 RepID=UPI00131EEB95|nr:toll/interleukin-1 receptor domain-containing protein [Plantactinospora sp. BC1]